MPDGPREPYEPKLKRQVAALGLSARCHFIGHCSQIAELYRAADVTVLPSVRSEAFGRSVIESMASGTPAVASRVGGIPEILTGEFDQYLFPVRDHRALAGRLASLRGWCERDPGLADRCRAHVERHFDIVNMVGGVEASLERTVAEWSAGGRMPAAGRIGRSGSPCASA
jgi:glycosyltransferase involved in cell wall biosynthesis